jgi:hypothetical protein
VLLCNRIGIFLLWTRKGEVTLFHGDVFLRPAVVGTQQGTGLTPVSPPVSPPVATPSGSAGNHLHHSLEMVPLLLAITSYLIFLGHLQ